MAANNSYIISEIGQTKRSPQGKINTGENLRIIQPSQAFPPLLASSTIDKVGHLLVLVLMLVLLEIDVPMTTGPTPIISPTPHRPQLSSCSQGRSNSQDRRPPSGSRNQYPDSRPQQPYTDRSSPPQQARPLSNSQPYNLSRSGQPRPKSGDHTTPPSRDRTRSPSTGRQKANRNIPQGYDDITSRDKNGCSFYQDWDGQKYFLKF